MPILPGPMAATSGCDDVFCEAVVSNRRTPGLTVARLFVREL